jgi:uncharacterized phage infection (PIP) family protein YhgE
MIGSSLPIVKWVAPLVAAAALAAGWIGYAAHEHAKEQALASQNQQVTAELNATNAQVNALTAKVNALATSNATAQSPASGLAASGNAARPRAGARRNTVDPRFNKMQTQLDAQGKQIDAQGQEISDARSDLTNTRTELTGSIARTHDELVVLEKKGERNYVEFDLGKSKQFKHEGPVGISLRKANDKKGYADLMLMVDDRNLQTKHVNLYQPSMFYEPDSPQPIEIVINDISKDHIHGYVSAPKYRKSELDAMASNTGNPTAQPANSGNGDNDIVGAAPQTGSDQGTNPNVQQPVRQKLPMPSAEPNEE